MKEINKVELGFDAEVRKAFADFISAKATIAEATAQKEVAQEILFKAVGANNQATFGGVLAFKIVDGKNSRADLKVLAEKYPEVYTEVLRTTDYKQIRTA